MKKLLCSAAVAGLVAVAAAPAMAQGDQSALKLDLGGYFRGYVAAVDNDTQRGVDERNVDILRDTEVHFTGETTLDNGLTIGVHVESDTDMGDSFNVDESYLYTSGSWGRVNFGAEDGSAYLLQIAAPSADSNVDGIRQYIRGANYDNGVAPAYTLPAPFVATTVAGTVANFANIGGYIDNTFVSTAPLADAVVAGQEWGNNNGAFLKEDYAQDATKGADKLTYLSPVFNGFQAGVSYTPDVASANGSRSFGVNADDVINQFGSAWELAARYEGQFDRFGLTLGAGYTHVDLEKARAAQNVAGTAYNGLVRHSFTDDRDLWNVGGTVAFGGFNFGALYTHDDRGEIAQDVGTNATTAALQRASYTTDSDSRTWVLGADYTTGPWKVGASYLNREAENMGLNYTGGVAGTFAGYSDLETDRYAAGVTYTYGPGMTFRGSIHHAEHEIGHNDMDATSFLLGTQVNF